IALGQHLLDDADLFEPADLATCGQKDLAHASASEGPQKHVLAELPRITVSGQRRYFSRASAPSEPKTLLSFGIYGSGSSAPGVVMGGRSSPSKSSDGDGLGSMTALCTTLVAVVLT